MTCREIRLLNLIDERTAQYGYGGYNLEQDLGGRIYTVKLSSPCGKRDKTLIIFSEAAQRSMDEGALAETICRNIDRELGEGNCGRV